jgi:methionyl aminopeptidase
MPIVIKSRREIELMRVAGRLGREILEKMAGAARAGVSTAELDELARRELEQAGARALSKNYPSYRAGEGFPGHTCISVNDEVVHGIPGPRTLKSGDIVTLDLALSLNGFCADTALTIPIGEVSADARRLLEVTRQTLEMAIGHIKPGKRWSDVARLMQYHVETHGFSVVREFVGHGIGRTMHEDPKVPNFVTAEQLRGDFRLRPGMTLAVEPMVVMGRRDVDMLSDGWTVVTHDHSPAAHFEHTVAVTEEGADVLTDGRVPVPSSTAIGGA